MKKGKNIEKFNDTYEEWKITWTAQNNNFSETDFINKQHQLAKQKSMFPDEEFDEREDDDFGRGTTSEFNKINAELDATIGKK